MVLPTANYVVRVLNPEAFKQFLASVPGVDPRVHDLIYPGPDFNLKVDLPHLDVEEFKIFEGSLLVKGSFRSFLNV